MKDFEVKAEFVEADNTSHITITLLERGEVEIKTVGIPNSLVTQLALTKALERTTLELIQKVYSVSPDAFPTDDSLR